MTPQEKAVELYNRFFREVPFLQLDNDIRDDMNASKRCALIAISEIEEFMSPMVNSKQAYDYWDNVKQEIKNL